MTSSTVLSPLAPAFQPTFYSECAEFAIYANGEPTMICPGDSGEGTILHGISDEAIEELFPPTATEAAEIEAVESFIEVLAELSLLEDSEERARRDFGHIKKRWEARRQDGLTGRPKPARHTVSLEPRTPLKEGETSLIACDHSAKIRSELANRVRAKEERMHLAVPKNVRGQHGFKPIHQPKKM